MPSGNVNRLVCIYFLKIKKCYLFIKHNTVHNNVECIPRKIANIPTQSSAIAEAARVTIRSVIAVDRLILTVTINELRKLYFADGVVDTWNSVAGSNCASAQLFRDRIIHNHRVTL